MLRSLRLPLLLSAVSAIGCAPDTSPTEVDVSYHSSSSRVRVRVTRELMSGETLHARVRRGEIGALQCASESGAIPRIDEARVPSEASPTFEGPSMTPSDFDTPYDSTDWLEMEPTAEMLAAIADGQVIIDVCLMAADGTVVVQAELDARRALDRRGMNGKFDGREARIASTVAYAEHCVDEMGEIPFFPEIAEGDYETYDCLDSTPIPTTITGPSGTVSYPATEVDDCDNPQFIYSLCEPSAQGPDGVRPDVNGPRVASRANDQGTHWVLLCRKARSDLGQYNDIAMIGHNPYTGQTCYFQNALYSRTDGNHVPHPGDRVQSERSPQQSSSIWEGIHGGLGGGIECAECHSTDAFIHTPWIDGALDEDGDPVVPRMGIHEDFALGYNDAPYHILNTDGQGWTMPRQLVSEEASACTRCHRIGDGRWTRSWIDRLVGEDTRWTNITSEAYRAFEHTFWMPPELDGLDESTFWQSDYGLAVRHIQACGDNPSDPACDWADIPRDSSGEDGALPTVDLEGPALATAALRILGADIDDPSCPDGKCETRRCAECHSVSRNGLRRWLDYTDHAWQRCGVTEGARDLDQAVLDLVNRAEQAALDDDIGIRSDAAAAIVQARPFDSLDQLEAVDGVGPATIRQLSEHALGDPAHMTQTEAREVVDCLRVDPTDPESVFAAEHLGILTTGVQYGWFRRLFRQAYGDGWLIPYTRFKNRVSMPKGSHPALSQQEYATLLTWFRNDLNDLETVLDEPPPPATCTDAFDTVGIQSHVENMQFEGWGVLNEDAGVRMFGCAGADPSACFMTGDYADERERLGGTIGVLRNLRELGFRTSFWTRSSADGRFVGNGGGDGARSTITDLLTGRDIGVDAAYDPGFFPDNSGFIFQGTKGGAGICAQSVLEDDDHIDFEEAGCMTARGINLYQHVARGIGGGDYFVINSQFTSDSGRNATRDPAASFNAASTMKLTPMIFDGTQYQPQDEVIVDSPYEGDSVLSPSGQLVGSRLAGPEGRGLGYVVRRVNATRFGDRYSISLSDPLATVCMSGAKLNFSFDERFFVTHHHDGEVTNIILVDLMTGERHAITDVPAGTRALFPHFRSDGWFYFLVMDGERELIIASDAALVIAGG
ncbi:MAG: hypothetical protein SangKO_060700 [Sandaracinaceae bacterium]